MRRIGFLAFDGVQALDLVGPADAFASDAFAALDVGEEVDAAGRPYEVVVVGLERRRFTTSAGLVMQAHATAGARLQLDTLMVPGGAGLRRPGVAERAASWIATVAPRLRRIASVCTGIYGVAPTGLLDGRRVTTHWSAAPDIARRFPALRVDGDAIFVKDGPFYTSAGVTAGIDLALSLIEEDFGGQVALAVAREMVVYLKRPGGQQQFSEPLRFQMRTGGEFGDLAAWLHGHLGADLSVESLAARSCRSVRHFSRTFAQAFGATPAAFVEELRLAEGSRRLSSPGANVATIARSVGYAREDVFCRAFKRRFGVSPQAYRRRFALGAPRAAAGVK